MNTKTLIAIGISLLALGSVGGFVARGAGPATITERTVEVRLKDTVINNTYKVDAAELQRLIQDQFAKLKKNVRHEETTRTLPDGTKETKTVDTDTSVAESGSHSDSSTDTHTTATGGSSTTEHELHVDDRFKQVTTSGGPRWAVGALATYQPFGTPPGYSLLPNERLTIAVTVDHRFFGPVWLGGVVTSNLAVGGGLKLVF